MNNEEKILSLLESMNGRLENLEAGQTAMNGRLGQIESDMSAVKVDVADMKIGQGKLETKVDMLDRKVDAVKRDTQATFEQVVILTEFKTQISSDVAGIREDQKKAAL